MPVTRCLWMTPGGVTPYWEISSCISQSTEDLAATGPLKLELATPRYKGHADYGILQNTMHDLNYFRDHLDVFAEMAKKRGAALDLDAFRKFDKERRELITATEQLKAQRNKASEEIARLKKEKQSGRADRRDETGVRAHQA